MLHNLRPLSWAFKQLWRSAEEGRDETSTQTKGDGKLLEKLGRYKKLFGVLGLVSLAFAAAASSRPLFRAVGMQIDNVFVTNFPASPVPVKDATSFTTFFGTFNIDSLGQIFLTGAMNVTGFDKVSCEIVSLGTTTLTVQAEMGKLSGETLALTVDTFPLGTATNNHTDEIVGPEFSIIITGGSPNTPVGIQAWVYLH